jgi:hypothetical protein
MNRDIYTSLAFLPAPVALLGVVILVGVAVIGVAS